MTTAIEAALDLVGWLDRSTMPTGPVALRERYKLSTKVWNPALRPDGNIEAVYTYLLAWQHTGNAAYLTKSRAIWDAMAPLQYADGSWPFSNLVGDWPESRWANDNSEVAIFLLRAALIDTDRAATYRAAALDTLAYLLTTQHTLKFFRTNMPMMQYLAAWSTAHVVTALSLAYPLAGASQAAYVTAINLALEAVISQIQPDGRIRTGYEAQGTEESWRPPSSEQSICIRALAAAELAFPESPNVTTWRNARQDMLGWLVPLVHPSGAIRNGYGVGVTFADVYHVTDHVYTTAFAVEAFRMSYALDGVTAYRDIADGILAFAAGNIWHDATDPDADGCLRGAYDLTAQNFDTSEIPQNGAEEGGGDMAYTGWSAAPVAALLFEDPPAVSAGRRGASAAAFL